MLPIALLSSAPHLLAHGCRTQVPQGVDLQFIALLDSYRPSGGLARAEETLHAFQRRGGPGPPTLAGWVARREVVSLDWNGQSWMPMFQFDLAAMAPRPQLAPVQAELNAVYSPWALAAWFAQCNPWLDGERPADVLVSESARVLDAARADRFVALG